MTYVTGAEQKLTDNTRERTKYVTDPTNIAYVKFDPNRPEELFEYLDNVLIDTIKNTKFNTVEQVLKLISTVDQTKDQIRSQLSALPPKQALSGYSTNTVLPLKD